MSICLLHGLGSGRFVPFRAAHTITDSLHYKRTCNYKCKSVSGVNRAAARDPALCLDRTAHRINSFSGPLESKSSDSSDSDLAVRKLFFSVKLLDCGDWRPVNQRKCQVLTVIFCSSIDHYCLGRATVLECHRWMRVDR